MPVATDRIEDDSLPIVYDLKTVIPLLDVASGALHLLVDSSQACVVFSETGNLPQKGFLVRLGVRFKKTVKITKPTPRARFLCLTVIAVTLWVTTKSRVSLRFDRHDTFSSTKPLGYLGEPYLLPRFPALRTGNGSYRPGSLSFPRGLVEATALDAFTRSVASRRSTAGNVTAATLAGARTGIAKKVIRSGRRRSGGQDSSMRGHFRPWMSITYCAWSLTKRKPRRRICDAGPPLRKIWEVIGRIKIWIERKAVALIHQCRE